MPPIDNMAESNRITTDTVQAAMPLPKLTCCLKKVAYPEMVVICKEIYNEQCNAWGTFNEQHCFDEPEKTHNTNNNEITPFPDAPMEMPAIIMEMNIDQLVIIRIETSNEFEDESKETALSANMMKLPAHPTQSNSGGRESSR